MGTPRTPRDEWEEAFEASRLRELSRVIRATSDGDETDSGAGGT